MKLKIPNLLKLPKKFKILIGVLVILVIAAGYFWKTGQNKKTTDSFQTETVKRGELSKSLTLSGQVEKSNLISVFTKASGVVTKVYVTDNQVVTAGQKLAEINLDSEGINNQASAWASYLSAKKNYESAQATKISQQSTMFSEWDTYMNKTEEARFEDTDSAYRTLPEFLIAQDDWLAAEANYKLQDTAISSSQASLSQASYNYNLYQATVTAPVDGTIIGLNFAEGLTISYSEGNSGGAASQTVATIKTEGKPIASFNVTEIDIPNLKVDQQATITLDSYENEKFTGSIVAVDRVGEISSNVTQYPVLISFDQNDDKILTNMAATAVIVFEKKENVLSVSTSAITQMPDGTNTVRVLKDNQVQVKPVTLGISNDTKTEITSGLEEGDVVITGTASQTTSSNSNSGGGFGMGMMGGGGPGGEVRGASSRSR